MYHMPEDRHSHIPYCKGSKLGVNKLYIGTDLSHHYHRNLVNIPNLHPIKVVMEDATDGAPTPYAMGSVPLPRDSPKSCGFKPEKLGLEATI